MAQPYRRHGRAQIPFPCLVSFCRLPDMEDELPSVLSKVATTQLALEWSKGATPAGRLSYLSWISRGVSFR
jgi:hypothetical protein